MLSIAFIGRQKQKTPGNKTGSSSLSVLIGATGINLGSFPLIIRHVRPLGCASLFSFRYLSVGKVPLHNYIVKLPYFWEHRAIINWKCIDWFSSYKWIICFKLSACALGSCSNYPFWHNLKKKGQLSSLPSHQACGLSFSQKCPKLVLKVWRTNIVTPHAINTGSRPEQLLYGAQRAFLAFIVA